MALTFSNLFLSELGHYAFYVWRVYITPDLWATQQVGKGNGKGKQSYETNTLNATHSLSDLEGVGMGMGIKMGMDMGDGDGADDDDDDVDLFLEKTVAFGCTLVHIFTFWQIYRHPDIRAVSQRALRGHTQ